MKRSYLFLILALALLVSSVGCNGEDCSETPTVDKIQKVSKERLEALLDDADAYERQEKRVYKMLAEARPEQKKVRVQHEKIRKKIIAVLLAEKLDIKAFKKNVNAMSVAYGAYSKYVLSKAFQAHAMFTDEQRAEIGKSIDKDPEEVGTFLINRGIEYALFKIDATDAQTTLVWAERDRVVGLANTLMRSQNKIRKQLIKQWNAEKPDSPKVDVLVARGAKQIHTFIYAFADSAFKVVDTLTPEQRVYTNSQVSRMKRCTETANLLPHRKSYAVN